MKPKESYESFRAAYEDYLHQVSNEGSESSRAIKPAVSPDWRARTKQWYDGKQHSPSRKAYKSQFFDQIEHAASEEEREDVLEKWQRRWRSRSWRGRSGLCDFIDRVDHAALRRLPSLEAGKETGQKINKVKVVADEYKVSLGVMTLQNVTNQAMRVIFTDVILDYQAKHDLTEGQTNACNQFRIALSNPVTEEERTLVFSANRANDCADAQKLWRKKCEDNREFTQKQGQITQQTSFYKAVDLGLSRAPLFDLEKQRSFATFRDHQLRYHNLVHDSRFLSPESPIALLQTHFLDARTPLVEAAICADLLTRLKRWKPGDESDLSEFLKDNLMRANALAELLEEQLSARFCEFLCKIMIRQVDSGLLGSEMFHEAPLFVRMRQINETNKREDDGLDSILAGKRHYLGETKADLLLQLLIYLKQENLKTENYGFVACLIESLLYDGVFLTEAVLKVKVRAVFSSSNFDDKRLLKLLACVIVSSLSEHATTQVSCLDEENALLAQLFHMIPQPEKAVGFLKENAPSFVTRYLASTDKLSHVSTQGEVLLAKSMALFDNNPVHGAHSQLSVFPKPLPFCIKIISGVIYKLLLEKSEDAWEEVDVPGELLVLCHWLHDIAHLAITTEEAFDTEVPRSRGVSDEGLNDQVSQIVERTADARLGQDALSVQNAILKQVSNSGMSATIGEVSKNAVLALLASIYSPVIPALMRGLEKKQFDAVKGYLGSRVEAKLTGDPSDYVKDIADLPGVFYVYLEYFELLESWRALTLNELRKTILTYAFGFLLKRLGFLEKTGEFLPGEKVNQSRVECAVNLVHFLLVGHDSLKEKLALMQDSLKPGKLYNFLGWSEYNRSALKKLLKFATALEEGNEDIPSESVSARCFLFRVFEPIRAQQRVARTPWKCVLPWVDVNFEENVCGGDGDVIGRHLECSGAFKSSQYNEDQSRCIAGIIIFLNKLNFPDAVKSANYWVELDCALDLLLILLNQEVLTDDKLKLYLKGALSPALEVLVKFACQCAFQVEGARLRLNDTLISTCLKGRVTDITLAETYLSGSDRLMNTRIASSTKAMIPFKTLHALLTFCLPENPSISAEFQTPKHSGSGRFPGLFGSAERRETISSPQSAPPKVKTSRVQGSPSLVSVARRGGLFQAADGAPGGFNDTWALTATNAGFLGDQ
jgi:hypothetical protein